jgi:hypothetical protein
VLILGVGAISGQDKFPKGWRTPTRVEATGDWRQKSRTRFLKVTADFDGDGKPDVAYLLMNDSPKRFGLFVQLSSQPGDWQLLHQGYLRSSVSGFPDLGIDVVRPGKYDTLCGDDPSACGPDTPGTLNLRTSAIEFFAYGETSTYYYWDRKAKKFLGLAMSD